MGRAQIRARSGASGLVFKVFKSLRLIWCGLHAAYHNCRTLLRLLRLTFMLLSFFPHVMSLRRFAVDYEVNLTAS